MYHRLFSRISSLKNRFYLLILGVFLKSIGKRSTIDFPIKIKYPCFVSIGDDVAINAFVHIWGTGGVTIGNRVMIASNSILTTLGHNPDEKCMRFSPVICKPIVIEDDVWIGCNATILPGITIGQGAVIASGSVVTKDVEPFSIVAGIPARITRMRKHSNKADSTN